MWILKNRSFPYYRSLLEIVETFGDVYVDGVDEDQLEDQAEYEEVIFPHDDMSEDWSDDLDDQEPDYYTDDYQPPSYDDMPDFDKPSGEGLPFKIVLPVRQKSVLPNWDKPISLSNPTWHNEDPTTYQFYTHLLTTLVAGPGVIVKDLLQQFCYVGPLRKVPARSFSPMITKNESRWADGLAAYDTLFFEGKAFVDRVNKWLLQKNRLATGYSIEVKKYKELDVDSPLMLSVLQNRMLDEDMNLRGQLLNLPVKYRMVIRDEVKGLELAAQDIGVGISQVLPVVVAALHHKIGIVAIEQPELHIHPAFQVALGDLFIEQIRQRSDLSFILETHSEHLMLRFLRRIRETGENEVSENRALNPEDLSIYFIEQGETGISCLPIRVDEDGDFIDHWPRGFFDERAGELF